jgi:hypothetical protein
MKTTMKQDTTLKEFLAIVMADIDIFLLQDETQTKDKDKLYTKEEIRSQLEATLKKVTNLPIIGRGVFEVPLFSTLSEKVLENSGFSKNEIKRYKESQQ